jgi:hypothetical protein
MNTDSALFKTSLRRLPKNIAKQFGAGTPEFIAWLGQHRVPKEVVEHFEIYSVTGKSGVEVGFATFWPEHLIRTYHDDTLEYFGAGWLIIGAMPNGDFVVLDIGGGTGAVSYVSHEEIWDKPNHVRHDLQSICVRICDSVGQFIDGLLEDRYPYDYFEAREQED